MNITTLDLHTHRHMKLSFMNSNGHSFPGLYSRVQHSCFAQMYRIGTIMAGTIDVRGLTT